MQIKLDQIKLANPVKVGRNEEVVFSGRNNFRSHGSTVELVAVKMPVENSSKGECWIQPLVKITDNQTKEVTYTSLMNTIYFKGELVAEEENNKVNPNRRAAKI